MACLAASCMPRHGAIARSPARGTAHTRQILGALHSEEEKRFVVSDLKPRREPVLLGKHDLENRAGMHGVTMQEMPGTTWVVVEHESACHGYVSLLAADSPSRSGWCDLHRDSPLTTVMGSTESRWGPGCLQEAFPLS